MHRPVFKKIMSCPRLPTLPAVALEVLELTRGEDVDLRRVAEVIRNDQALAAKVIRTVNSSYYGLSRPCGTIHQAMVYLGLNTVKTVVLGFSLAERLSGGGDEDVTFDYMTYWRRGLYSAAAAKQLAAATGACDPEEAFLAALVQDIGMVAMQRALGDQYLQTIDIAGDDHRDLPAVEREKLELDHAEVGAAIAEQWKFPESIVSAIRHHHSADRAPDAARSLARIVDLAGLAALSVLLDERNAVMKSFGQRGGEWFDLKPDATRQVLADLGDAVQELSSLFKLSTGERPDFDEILLAAESQLVEHQVQMQRESDALRKTNQMLARKSMTDPLTALANRACFDDALARHFHESVNEETSLTLIFCDLDHFKSINDTHGHQVGDAVLRQVARVMADHIGEQGVVARYGGEEFAVIVPGIDREGAADLAESLRRAVEQNEIDSADCGVKDAELRVTLSLGVAVLETELARVLKKPQSLLRVADQAVYAAKNAGRNCVRVFTPPPPENRQAA